jgi:diguanylate cyclase (GGDEF)-like protein
MGAHFRPSVFRRMLRRSPSGPEANPPGNDLLIEEAVQLGRVVDQLSGEVKELTGEVEELNGEIEELRLENQQLQQGMLIDRHSGLANGAAFDADLAQLDARWRRNDESYSVLFVDVDHFHGFDGALGEDPVQGVLRSVADAVAETVRQGDRSYRLTGEEFGVLLPGTQLREAVAAAERVRRRVEKLGIAHPAGDPGVVTVTIAAIGAGFRHKGPKDVVAELQDLMVTGKQSGRNRVVWPH